MLTHFFLSRLLSAFKCIVWYTFIVELLLLPEFFQKIKIPICLALIMVPVLPKLFMKINIPMNLR